MDQVKSKSVGALQGAASGAFLILVFLLLWELLAPVVGFMRLDNVTRINGVVEGEVRGYKLKNCAVIGGTVVGWYKVNGEWVDGAPFEFVDDATPDSSRPPGRQSFDVWRWSDIPDAATDVRITLTHSCRFGLQVTTVGEWGI